MDPSKKRKEELVQKVVKLAARLKCNNLNFSKRMENCKRKIYVREEKGTRMQADRQTKRQRGREGKEDLLFLTIYSTRKKI